MDATRPGKVSLAPSQDAILSSTQSFSLQEVSCSSAVLFDNSMDVSADNVVSGPSVSPELYSEPLGDNADLEDNVQESQPIGYSLSDSYMAECGALTQLNEQPIRNENKPNHREPSDLATSTSDEFIAKHCESILPKPSYGNRQQNIDDQNRIVEEPSRTSDNAPIFDGSGRSCARNSEDVPRSIVSQPLSCQAQKLAQESYEKIKDESKEKDKRKNDEGGKITRGKSTLLDTDADNIIGEFDSGSHFQAETYKSGPSSPENTCALTMSEETSSNEELDEIVKEGTLDFSLNLSLSESPFDEGYSLDHTLEINNENVSTCFSNVDNKPKTVQEKNGDVLNKALDFSSSHDHSLFGAQEDLTRVVDEEKKHTKLKPKGRTKKMHRPEELGTSLLLLDTEKDFWESSSSSDVTDSSPSPPHDTAPASPSCTFSTVSIVNISANELLFHHFIKEWKGRKEFSFAVASERVLDNVPRIGGRFNKGPSVESTLKGLGIDGTNEALVGVAVCWGGRDSYYISLKDCRDVTNCPDESMVASRLPLATRIEGIKSVLEYNGKRRKGMKFCFDATEHYKALAQACGITLSGEVEDPKVAAWLLDPSSREKSLHHLAAEFISDKADLLQGTGAGFGCGSLGLASHSPMGGRARACTEAVLSYWLMLSLREELKKVELDESFLQVEMPLMKCLARMELNGIGFSEDECERLKSILQAKLRNLEEAAYRLAKRSFSLTSPDDVATVLFLELKLPVDGKLDENGPKPIKRRTLGTSRRVSRGGRKQLKHLSTNKEVLERLKQFHPLPGIILEWRRINSALTKVVYPVQREKLFNQGVNMNRIYTTSQIHTATGRVSFAEPNLQNVPRDFEIDLPQESCDANHVTGIVSVSMRNTFVSFDGGIMLAADYSQLELRLIAHLSSDQRLLKLLNAGGDVFKMIAGSLNGVEPTAVSDVQRQQAKQICYGIIYGIGAKSLGEQLKVNENDASVFIDKFKSRFSGIRKYLKSTIDNCRKDGFVLTVTKRRRYLPGINSTNGHARNQAERQAVNTTVQGSAADLVKMAMINIDRKLSEMYPTTRMTHRHKLDQNVAEVNLRRRSTRISAQTPKHRTSAQAPKGAFVVLQLHDELILEVAEGELNRVAAMIKKEMETAMKLSVVLPVKLKAGPSWGSMAPLDL